MVNIHMKLPKVVETLLNDKNVLYIVAFLATMNFFGYIILRDSYALLIFYPSDSSRHTLVKI